MEDLVSPAVSLGDVTYFTPTLLHADQRLIWPPSTTQNHIPLATGSNIIGLDRSNSREMVFCNFQGVLAFLSTSWSGGHNWLHLLWCAHRRRKRVWGGWKGHEGEWGHSLWGPGAPNDRCRWATEIQRGHWYIKGQVLQIQCELTSVLNHVKTLIFEIKLLLGFQKTLNCSCMVLALTCRSLEMGLPALLLGAVEYFTPTLLDVDLRLTWPPSTILIHTL